MASQGRSEQTLAGLVVDLEAAQTRSLLDVAVEENWGEVASTKHHHHSSSRGSRFHKKSSLPVVGEPSGLAVPTATMQRGTAEQST
eukprot:COSAG02_NODE_2806_length_7991_cov_21.891916_14_plen_86_part_00